MTSIVLLHYLCTAPIDDRRQSGCVAREAVGETCAQAVAIVEAGMRPDRWWFIAACVDGLPRPQRQRAGAR